MRLSGNGHAIESDRCPRMPRCGKGSSRILRPPNLQVREAERHGSANQDVEDRARLIYSTTTAEIRQNDDREPVIRKSDHVGAEANVSTFVPQCTQTAMLTPD